METIQPARGGYIKALCVGAILPVMTIFCKAARKEKPHWLIRESVYFQGRPLRNLCFAFGMVGSLSGMGAGIYHAEMWLINEFVGVSSKQEMQSPQKLPRDTRQLPEGQTDIRASHNILA